MGRARNLAIVLGGAAGVAALARHLRAARGRSVPGGIVMANVPAYEGYAALLLGPFYRSIARNVAAVVPAGARVLEVGCGPGRLSIDLARDHDLDVTGVDLDPAMIERAEANARSAMGSGRRPVFLVADAASVPLADASFDAVVSTLSLHHWADVAGGLGEVARVLRPDGRALVWDFRRGAMPFHRDLPDPTERMDQAALRIVDASPWRWPWRFSPTVRIELARVDPADPGRP